MFACQLPTRSRTGGRLITILHASLFNFPLFLLSVLPFFVLWLWGNAAALLTTKIGMEHVVSSGEYLLLDCARLVTASHVCIANGVDNKPFFMTAEIVWTGFGTGMRQPVT